MLEVVFKQKPKTKKSTCPRMVLLHNQITPQSFKTETSDSLCWCMISVLALRRYSSPSLVIRCAIGLD